MAFAYSFRGKIVKIYHCLNPAIAGWVW